MKLNKPITNLMYKACMKASKSLIRDFGEVENLQVSSKGPGDFVSSADKRTEKILIDELQKAHPEFGIITEEAGIINKSNTRIVLERVWITRKLLFYKTLRADFALYKSRSFIGFSRYYSPARVTNSINPLVYIPARVCFIVYF